MQVFAADCYFGVVAMLLNALSHTQPHRCGGFQRPHACIHFMGDLLICVPTLPNMHTSLHRSVPSLLLN